MKKLEWLEAMRGLAACWVLLTHAHLAAKHFAGLSGTHWQFAVNGYLGVDFFFVLSGFIIAVSSQSLLDTGRGFRDYVTARAIRIYVPYLPVGVAVLIGYALLPGLSQGSREPSSLLTSLTLLPDSAPPALSVAWTLVHELIFYALFSLFFVSRRVVASFLILWAAGITLVWANGTDVGRLLGYFLSPLNLCFVLGVTIA
jgi:peptidoglycan/LPS O-acetylase OafA/YrhL